MIPDVVYREIHGGVVPTEIAVAHRRHEKAPAVRAFIRQVRERGKAAAA